MSHAIIISHHESSFLGSTFEIDNESNDPFVIVYESLLGKSHTISHTYDDVTDTSLWHHSFTPPTFTKGYIIKEPFSAHYYIKDSRLRNFLYLGQYYVMLPNSGADRLTQIAQIPGRNGQLLYGNNDGMVLNPNSRNQLGNRLQTVSPIVSIKSSI